MLIARSSYFVRLLSPEFKEANDLAKSQPVVIKGVKKAVMIHVIKYLQSDMFNPIGDEIYDQQLLNAMNDETLLDACELALYVRVAADQFLLRRL